MSKHNIFELKDRDTISDALTEMLRTGANQLIHQAVQIELEELLIANAHRLTPDGNAAVVRNGYQPQREILTGIGPVTVKFSHLPFYLVPKILYSVNVIVPIVSTP